MGKSGLCQPTAPVVVALVLAVSSWATACTGSGDDSPKPAATPDQDSAGEAVGYYRARRLMVEDDFQAVGQGDRAQIEEVLNDVQIGLAAGKGLATCHELTAAGVYEVARLRGGDFQGCKDVVREIGQRRRQTGEKSKMSQVLSVRIDRPWASVLVLDPDGSTYRVPFVQEIARAWKLTSLVLLDAGAIDSLRGGAVPTSEETRSRGPEGALYNLQANFTRGRSKSVCDNLTTSARHEVLALDGEGGSCEAAVRRIRSRLLARGFQPRSSRVVSVKKAGDRATLRVKDAREPAYDVPVVREDGAWRLSTLAHAIPLDTVTGR